MEAKYHNVNFHCCANLKQVAVACEYGNELSGSIKCGEFLD